MVNKNLLLIFIKNPERGNVKTRLARSIGDDQALKVYRKLLSITKSATDQLNVDRQIWYSNFIDDEDLWSTGGYEKKLQQGDDLGERMEQAFRQAFTDDYEKVVIIGSDCATLTSQIIERAFRALDDNEVVIGPSQDGGYYLLGMKSFYQDLFAGINWSTPAVYEETISKVQKLNLSFELMPKLNDIDNKQDLLQSEIATDL